MSTLNAKQKGARAEREFAKLLREYGYDAERGCQYSGGKDSPDVKTNMLSVHWEVKHVEKLNIHKAIEQSIKDSGEGEIPLVAHRRNREPWYVTLSLTDFMKLFKAYEREIKGEKTQ